MSSSSEVLINVVCPTLGVVISNIMFLTPLPLVMRARRNRHLGNINPVPFAAMFVSNIGYVIYGAMLANYYLFFSAVFGVLLSLFYCVTCLTIIAKEAVEDEFSELYRTVECLVLFGIGFWMAIGMAQRVLFQGFADPEAEAAFMVGLLCDFFSICYYAAPLSSMLDVVRRRDASSLYLPAILVNCANACMWMTYGIFGFGSFIVYGPSSIGLVLSLVQVGLVLLYHEGHWLDAASGFVTRRTIQIKKRIFEDEEASQGSPSPGMKRSFSVDRYSEYSPSPAARRMTFVVASRSSCDSDSDSDNDNNDDEQWRRTSSHSAPHSLYCNSIS